MGWPQFTKCSVTDNFLGNSSSYKRSITSSRPHTGDIINGDFSKLYERSYTYYNELMNPEKKKKTLAAEEMIWDSGFLACFVPSCLMIKHQSAEQSQNHNQDGHVDNNNNLNSEHNKAWLLAESGGCASNLTNGEPHSVHSSFRFSLCTQVEVDSLNIKSSNSTTILMVNLDSTLPTSRPKEHRWRRFQSLEKTICISPVANSLIRFSYREIQAATRNLCPGRVLGRGALSFVYRGKIGLMRTAVAVKRLDKEDKESSKAFYRELMIASSLQHPNIVPLLGFCIDPEEGLFLVYKYVSSGSLEHHLCRKKRGDKGSAFLSWSMRYKIAIGVAEAIAYLHNGTERCVVHRDIKPSNILLSSKKMPELCDFGLATWTQAPSVPFLCKTVKGTFGYLAPEYFQHGKVSDKTDVYAFGVVLLELLTGRKPIESNRPPGEENLVEWAKPLLDQGRNTRLDKLLDPRVKYTPKSWAHISRMARAASACLRCEESTRPGMIEVIAFLRGDESFCYVNHKLGSSRYASNRYSLHQQTKKEMTNHLALAMLGVSELEDDDYLYGR